MTRRNGRKPQNVVVRRRCGAVAAQRTVRMMAALLALCGGWMMEAQHAPLVWLVKGDEDGAQAAASDNFLGDILSALFPSWFPCGVFSAANGCGLLNFGALMRQGEPETAECEQVCTYFAGLSSSYSEYECGSCGNNPPTTGETPTPPVDDGNFEITLDLQVRSGIGNVFRQAAARWEEVVVGGLPDLTNVPNAPSNRPCTYPNVVNDLYICVYEDEIDGKGKTIGYAGVDYTRGTGRKLPVLSYAYFDWDDLDDGANTASWFPNLVIHEFGHSLGFGLEWECPSNSFSNSPRANEEYQAISGCTDTPPTQGNAFGSSGSSCIHWEKDNCFRSEIMTPIIGSNAKLSRITIGALDDMGYEVNYDAADAFTTSDLGSDCICRRRAETGEVRTLLAEYGGGDGESPPRRQLSAAGHEDAIAKGRAFLQTIEPPLDDRSDGDDQALFTYTSDQYVFVYYLEEGEVYGVYVEPE